MQDHEESNGISLRTGMKPFVGTATDYSDPSHWLALPENRPFPADVIWFYPTACMDPNASLICAVDNPGMIAQAQMKYVQIASCFEGVGNIFAPLWRQVSGMALVTSSFSEVDKAEWAEPRTDIYAAMDYYFEHLNGGRPWIVAGHSQGSRMLGIMLGEYMREHPAYYERMIAAYRIGDGLTRRYLAEYPHMKPAQCADDLGVCASWNTEGPANIGRHSLVVPPECVAINPLNWRTDETVAGEELCLGCLFPSLDGKLIPLEEKVSAVLNLERGTVIVLNPAMNKYSISEISGPMARQCEALFGPASFHNCDYSFFYYNIRENVKLRIRKWFEAHCA